MTDAALFAAPVTTSVVKLCVHCGDTIRGAGTGLTVHPDAVGTFRIFLTVPAGAAPSGSKPIEFTIRDATGRQRASHGAVFVGPTH